MYAKGFVVGAVAVALAGAARGLTAAATGAPQVRQGDFGYVPLAVVSATYTETWRATRRSGGADLWVRVRAGLQLTHPHPNPRIGAKIIEFQRDPRFLADLAQQAAPYLRVIVEEVERRGLPGELALLPQIESRYNPAATSRKAAAGLWQFIPATARLMGLHQDPWYDGRRDLLASTGAALDYLQQLHRRLGGDWELAMAAYNCGPGRVESAQAANRARGLPTDFWSLQLPAETAQYVPQILALALLVATPSRYGARLPALPDVPQVELIAADEPVTLVDIAHAGRLDLAQVQRLNAGLTQGHTRTGAPACVLVPVGTGHRVSAQLAGIRVLPAQVAGDRGNGREAMAPGLEEGATPVLEALVYWVRPGDSLGLIARRFGVGVAELRAWNPAVRTGVTQGQALRVFPRAGFAAYQAGTGAPARGLTHR